MNNIKLNILIFNQLIHYLVIDCYSFNRLLELSLISKSSFKIIQNLISSYQFNNNSNNKFILELHQLIQYIKNSNNNNNNNNYKFKLIQYKDIELIKINEIFKKECKKELLNSVVGSKSNLNLIIYKFFQFNCLNLKNVILLNTIECCNPRIKFDYTCKGFFIINSLKMIWSSSNPPPQLSNDDDEQPFSFLLKYNPIELIIGTYKLNYNIEDYKLQLYQTNSLKFDNILKYCKSIKSIKFENYPINKEFLKLLLSSNSNNSITSLKINGKEDSSLSNIVNTLIYSNFENNKILKKFEFKEDNDGNDQDDDDNYNFNKLIELISKNKSLESFGFYNINFTDKDCLKSLIINKSNINTLEIDENSLELVLYHCKENNNIKQIIIHSDFNIIKSSNDYKEEELQLIKLKYFKSKFDFQLLLLSSKLIKIKILNNKGILPPPY